MRRTAVAVVLAALLITAAAGTFCINLAKANPYSNFNHEWGPPPADAETPEILIISPNNNTLLAQNKVTLSLRATTTAEDNWIAEVYYEADWQKSKNSVYNLPQGIDQTNYQNLKTEIYETFNLTGIPDGNHSIKIVAAAQGYYVTATTVYYYEIAAASSVSFTIDNISPIVLVLSMKNVTFSEYEIPLNFTVDKPFSKLSYVLDDGDNVTIDGNSTLVGLPIGEHNVMVYAWDAAGNVGCSETVAFTVAEPATFPTVPVASTSIASAAFLGAGLLLYRRKRRREVAPA